MNLADVLLYLYPDTDALRDWLVANDGGRQYIAEWHLSAPRPTEEYLVSIEASDDFQVWMRERLSQMVDRDTGHEIDKALHPFAGVEQQIGILRNQIAQIINALGVTPTDGFANFNKIAIAKIQDGEQKKEAL